MITRKYLIPIALVAAIGAGAYGVSQVSAASSPNSNQSLVSRIASAFNLDPSKVQAVVDQYRTSQSSNREASYQDRLNQAVTNGQITSAQETAILAEHNTLATAITNTKSLSGDARQTALQQIRQEAKTWATANNIALKWVLGPGQLRGGRGQMPAPSASPALSTTPSS